MKKYFLLVCLMTLAILFFELDGRDYLTLDHLKTYQVIAQQWTLAHYQYAVGIYILLYVVMIACAIPCATILALAGGFLFGGIAVLYAVFSITAGGTVLFLAIRTAIGTNIAATSSQWVKRLEHGFRRNAFNYLLMLRLVPIMPCWVSNVTAGMLNVPMKTFLTASVLGVIPATVIYVMVGRGLGELLTAGPAIFPGILLRPSVFFPLIGLAFLSIFPVLYKSLKK